MLALGPVSGVVQARPAAQLLLRRDAARLRSRRATTGCSGAGFGGGDRVLLHAAVWPQVLGRLLHRLAGWLGLGLRLQLQDQVRRRVHDGAGTQRRRRLRGRLAAARGGVPRGAEGAPPRCLTPAEGTPQSAPDTSPPQGRHGHTA